jgi:FKBP-type peptidyl-prolyl cis-trans isomerase
MDGPYPGNEELPDSAVRFDIELIDVLPGVRVITVAQGEGSVARLGDTVSVHYKAYLNRDQIAYDSTQDRGGPIELRIGTGEVIQGWELGVIGMAEGETRTIEIPPYLGYGQLGAAGIIPPNATLRYTVELVRVTNPITRHADVGYPNGH